MNKIILRIVYFSKRPPQNDLDEIYTNAINLVELHQMSYITIAQNLFEFFITSEELHTCFFSIFWPILKIFQLLISGD